MERENLISAAKVKRFLKENNLKCASAVSEELSNTVYSILEDAIEDAKQKKQKTLLVKNL